MIGKLISIRLRSLFASVGSKSKNGTYAKPSTGKIVLFVCLYAFLAIMFAGFSSSIAIGLCPIFISVHAENIYFAFFVLASFSVVFVLSIFETKNELFDGKDNELLLSMPIKPLDIVVSRISTVLIFNYAEEAVVLLPAVAIFAFFGGAIRGVFGGILVFLLLPLLATALASVFGYVVALLSKRMRNKTIASVIFSVLFLAAYFAGYNAILNNLDEFLAQIAENPDIILNNFSFIAVFGAPAMLELIPTLVFVAVCLFGSFLAFFVISKSYVKIATSNEKAAKKVYKHTKLQRKSCYSALARKEFLRFTSSSTYMLNAGIGLIFTVAAAIFAVTQRSTILSFSVVEDIDLTSLFGIAAIGALFFLSSMSAISSPTLSLEGKNLWILKSSPISSKDVLLAKCTPHAVLTSVASVIASVLASIAVAAQWYEVIFILVAPVLLNLFFALFGVALNVALPKFDFISEAQVIKQSASVTIAVFGQMIIALIFAGIGVGLWFLTRNSLTPMIVLCLLLVVADIVIWQIVVGPCVKKYDKL